METEQKHHRSELVDFLQTRRARLTPYDVGLPAGSRRRTVGLRREEVASLANISATWYTWLEQGRKIRVSPQTLTRIAAALQLDEGERTYLFTLADQAVPKAMRGETVSVALQQMLDGMGLNPAYLTNHCWDVLDWSPAAAAGFIDFGRVEPWARNVLYDFFAEPARRTEFVDWERHARRMIAEFRASYGRHPEDPRFGPLIERCRAASPEFRLWWMQHEVQDRLPGMIELDRGRGRLTFSYASFAPSDAGALRLTIYTPTDTSTRTALTSALRRAAPRGRTHEA